MSSKIELPDERQAAILDRLAADGRVVAGALAHEFGISEDTIRRDLRDLAAAGRCRRVYGGALLPLPTSGPLRQRLDEDRDIKTALGQAAARLVEAGQTVMVDAGSTNLSIAKALPKDCRLTVVTNAPVIAAELAGRPDIDLIVIGGRVDPRSGGSFGPKACAEVVDIYPDLAFVGSCAIGPAGLAAFDADEAVFKRHMVRNAARTVTAVTTGKLAAGAPFAVAPLECLDIVVVEADAPSDKLAAVGLGSDRVLRASPIREPRA